MGKYNIPPSFGLRNSYADYIQTSGDEVWGDKVVGDTDITSNRKSVSPTPPTPTVEFSRYTTSIPVLQNNYTLYIPQDKDLQYFVDTPISEEVDPQPDTFEGVTIDTTKGKVYTATELDTNIYLAKDDNFVIVYNSQVGITPLSFTYNDVNFVSNSINPIMLSNLTIIGNISGWVCAENSIIISEDQIFIGNNVGKVVEFDRYKISDMSAVAGWSLFIPNSSQVGYFADMNNSSASDPQPTEFGSMTAVPIDTSKGIVYSANPMGPGFMVKTADAIIMWTTESTGYPQMSFYYNGVHFVSSSNDPIDISTIGITGFNGTWVCDTDSIIIGSLTNNQMFIGNNVVTPTA